MIPVSSLASPLTGKGSQQYAFVVHGIGIVTLPDAIHKEAGRRQSSSEGELCQADHWTRKAVRACTTVCN
jgi:hypothetical protein